MVWSCILYKKGIGQIIEIEPMWELYLILDFSAYGLYFIIAILTLKYMTPTNYKKI